MGSQENGIGPARQVIQWSAATVLACVLAQGNVRAQPADPMQPPGESSASRAGASAGAGAGLQLVITSPQRKLALIDGSVVPVGGKVRSGTLAGLSDSVAVLQKDGSRDVLLMHPNIQKTPSRREGTN
jgi:hypothetical protein